MPYIRKGLRSALRPTLANIATAILVFLPGMMTGQILGSASPLLAIKYQISIMIVILISTAMSATYSILTTTQKLLMDLELLKRRSIKKKARRKKGKEVKEAGKGKKVERKVIERKGKQRKERK